MSRQPSKHYPPICPTCGASLPHDNPMSREYHEYRVRQQQTVKGKSVYRWVEPETIWFDEQGNKIVIPEHQKQGTYVDESSIRGYVIVMLEDGKPHLVKDTDIVAIYS